jgi:hypothetical protein
VAVLVFLHSLYNLSKAKMSRQHVEAASKAFGDTLLGAGFDMLKSKAGDQHPAGPPQHGTMGQAERAFSAGSTFLSGVLA